MDLDPLSIITPARVKVILIPVGHVRQSRFEGFVQRLQQVNVVRLGDVSPDSRPHRSMALLFHVPYHLLTITTAMFSPLAFPEGLVLYDLSTSLPPPSHLALSPFEIYREPWVVIGLADGINAVSDATQDKEAKRLDDLVAKDASKVNELRSLVRTLEDLIDDFPKALVHQILVFDHDGTSLPERIYPVPTPSKSKTTTIKTVMCDLTSRLLAEMSTYAKSLQGLHTLDSPMIPSGTGKLNGVASAVPAHMNEISRTSSSRLASQGGDTTRSEHRMSVPAKFPSVPSSGISTPDSRPASPSNGARTPPTSLNEISGSASFPSPPKSTGHDRADSRSGAKASGFGADSLGERDRTKGKGRIGIAIGALYLLAGRWPDAVKELVQNAAVARNSSDYLWHAKAMDCVLVCLLMYAWAGMDFRIPESLFPGTERPGSSSSKSSKHTATNSLPDLGVTKSTDPVSRAASLRTLTSLLPDLTNTILNLYARAWTFTDDKLPPLAFSQSAVRFAKLLSAIRIHHGHLDDVLLRHLVLNTDLPLEENPSLEAVPFLTRGEVVELLFRAYPGPPSEMSMTIADHTTVLAGIASVLSTLGYHRKKALVLRELMISLLPALVQARKDGAAEMGVHPAASLATLNATVNAIPLENNGASLDDAEQGMRCFLWIVCRSYGIVPPEPSRGLDAEATATLSDQPSKGPSSPDGAQIAEVIAFRALQQASAKAAGPLDLKIDVLRSCINVCEALPDLVGALQFSAYLLRIGGSGIAPGPESSDGSPPLVIEEQVRLVNNIYRTLSAARQLGIEHPEAEYWDDFLVRGIEPVKAHSSKGVQPHAKSELELVSTMDAEKEKNPFIYNPFSKTKTSATREPLLVAKEESFFRITMQNLYDFEIVAERVRLLSDGVEFDCEAQATIIGPYRTQTIILSGTPLASGSLTIYGCSVKVKGCRERSYPTFSEPWSLKSGIKQRPWDLAGKSRLTSAASGEDKKPRLPLPPSPTASTLALKVLGAQPNVTLKSMSAPQAAIMLLEGESKILKLSLQNTSRLIPADLVLLSFDDSTTSQRQSTLPDQELSAIELHELELASASKQSIKLRHTNMTRDIEIEPGGETNIDIDLLGKPGLSYGTIQVDYGHLGTARADVKETFYTRQLVIPLTVTVNQSIEIVQADIVALPHNILPKQQLPHNQAAPGAESSTQDHTPSSTSSPPNFLNPGDSTSSSPPQCLLLLDFRNSWSNDLNLTLKVSDPSSTSSPTIHSQQIQPGTTQRVPLPLPRLYISNPHAPIPSLNPGNKRQFVVSATKNTPEAERAMRESFWYREALLGRLKATWREDGTGRSGDVDLRRLRLSPQMLAALKLPDLEISMSVTSAEPASSSSSSDGEDIEEVHMTKPSTYRVSTTIFLTLSTHLYNRSSSPIQPVIRLQPTLANQPQHVALDLSKKLLVNGLLQRALPTLRPGERKTMDTGFLVLSYGIYEWRASVEEVFTPGKEGNEIGRKRAATGELDVLTDMERRTWLAESPCTVIARDANEHVEASRYLDDR